MTKEPGVPPGSFFRPELRTVEPFKRLTFKRLTFKRLTF